MAKLKKNMPKTQNFLTASKDIVHRYINYWSATISKQIRSTIGHHYRKL